MTSRFGKTYSRKGGEGTSKFDEVLSTKKGTLSTKWGDTTYKAKVGSKRAGAPRNDSVLEVYKKPRPSADGQDDPFGFDSDEESKPVSSRAVSKSSPSKPASAEPPQAERPSFSSDVGSWSSFQGGSHTALSAEETLWPSGNGNQLRVMEDTARFFNSTTANTGTSWQNPALPQNQHSYSWYQNASDSDKQPLSQTTTLKSGSKAESTYDSWDAIVGLRPQSPVQEPRKPAPSLSWGSGGLNSVQSLHRKPPSPPQLQHLGERNDVMGGSAPAEKFPQTSASVSLERNSNCRTYRRPNKQGSGKAPDSSSFDDAAFGVTPEAPQTKTTGRGGGRGRTRDCTVLQPSSISMTNVTNQDRGREEFPADAAPPSVGPSGDTAELGETGWQRKKTEAQQPRPKQTKSKDDLFGFDDTDFDQGENSGDSTDGRSSYKIQYFGFDDMSDSDGADGDSEPHMRRKVMQPAVSTVTPALTAKEAMGDDVPDPFERLESRESLQVWEKPASRESKKTSERLDRKPHRGTVDFSEDSLRVLASGPRRPAMGKQAEKNPDTLRRIFSAHKKSPTKAVYNARHWTMESEEEPPPPFFSRSHSNPATVATGSSTKEPAEAQRDDGVFKAPPPPPKVTKCVTVPTDPYQDTVTALKCHKEHKELYTVVQHVKHFNDVVEFGENQEFTDDFEYLATGLKSGQPLNTRCLSVISLATRCAMPSFRMHLRARGKVAQVFKTLNDAPQLPNLALCTAALMYILSRDRLNMDLDRSCLDLMIRLLELDQDHGAGTEPDSSIQFSAKELAKIKEKIRKLCDTVHNKHLDLQNITTGHLAMETLLSLTSKRAGDWFKEELRLLGGLDHIVDKVKECVKNLDQEEKLVSSLWGAERCLRVLESVTVHNPENQSYLIAYKDSSLIVSSAKALRRCEQMIQRYSRQSSSDGAPLGKAVEDCMRAIIGVLLNLTHDNEWGSTKAGEQDALIETALNCVLKVPQFLLQEQRFDIRVLGLGLLINLVEYSARNRYFLIEMEMEGGQGPCDSTVLLGEQHQDLGSSGGPLSAIAALVQVRFPPETAQIKPQGGALIQLLPSPQLFLQRERAAVLAEAQTDDLIKEAPKPALDQSGEWQETGGEIQWVANDNASEKQDEGKKKDEEEDEPLDLNKALQHAGKHMEDSIVASYTALLLGCLCQGSPMNVTTVRENLPKGDFSIMTEMLKKFLNFMNLTCDVGTAGQKSISRIIDYLEHC
ncbi:wings apart-like protein homolog isoform X2 [Cyprinodon tularosa]|uniref:wings apart-like protein homolog isoform X2 n=1 Tax=Cyprinodon tularosa TaxID=77115 RepID=UPI0018E1F17F|nr:wings apart-like protein homolog isoform X2 [Cyprinodon tularosa]